MLCMQLVTCRFIAFYLSSVTLFIYEQWRELVYYELEVYVYICLGIYTILCTHLISLNMPVAIFISDF
jgi:hypothetical protein